MPAWFRRFLIAILIGLLAAGAAIPVAAAPRPQDESPWPQFQHDAARTGRTDIEGPIVPTPKWVYDTGEIIKGGLAVAADGTIYAPSRDFLYALRPDGSQQWRVDIRQFLVTRTTAKEGTVQVLADGGDITAPAIDRVGNIIVGTEDGRVLALRPNGELDWMFEVSETQYSSGPTSVRGPALLASGFCCLMVGADDNVAYKLAEDGTQLGLRQASGHISGAPARGPGGGEYWASQGSDLYVGNEGGSDRWRVSLDGPVYAGPAVGPDGTAYVGTEKGTLYAIREDGSEKWRRAVSEGTALRAAASLGADGTVYVGSDNGSVYVVGGQTGEIKWQYATNAEIQVPVLVDGRGNLYVASRDGHLYVLSPTGALLSTFKTGGDIVAAMALGSDGTLYVGSEDRKLYALTEADPNAAVSVAVASEAVQRDAESGRVYLVTGGMRYWVPDPATAALLRISPATWTDVRSAQLAAITEGPAIPALGEGSLIRVPRGEVYVIRDQMREWIPSLAAFTAGGFAWDALVEVAEFVAARIPVSMPEGTLVRGDSPEIYVIESGVRRWIPSLTTFAARGFQWNQLVVVGNAALKAIPEGTPLPS
ncbi:MAG: hypothetical protein CL878_12985 [Dehalococcoidia bacterium]|nr:hypothetical protein [Dehalococcoidia bacterium]